MPAQWTAEIVGKMHIHGISIKELSAHMGVSREYVGAILNGKRDPAEAEHRIREAVDDLIAQKSNTK